MSNQVLDKIKDIQKELNELEVKKDLPQSQRVIASIVRLLDDSVSVDDQSLFQLFTDSDGKIRANASWFYEDSVMTDRKATYKVHPQNSLNLDIKLYGITKPSKRTIAWAQSLTPNFEDEPFNKNFNVGIDFIVPKSADRIIVVLSNNWVIRTLELKGKLTVTFQEILARWAEIKNFDNKTELHNILWESFDIQPLNKKFYSGISERFTLLRQYLVKEKVFDEKHASLFANRLLGRVIFCWFLDKKGIINPDQKYFDSESFDNDNEYYKTKLERLFFGVLNTPIGDREFKDDLTPFLNGGLFEARKNDLYNDSKLSFPKNYFDDLFEFLSGYNFTTDESTSQFQQVAIDPEMLGRIFENLLAEMTEETGEQARKAKGAFYTPREIVDYMCKESLKEYLKTKIEKDEQLDQRLYQLIDAPDKDFQDQDHNWRRDWKPYKADIMKALGELKVLDPACGSGAFPIGMLQLLVRVYERLEARFDSYKTKLGIIEKNIYGVDIEPMAVEIARLRAWLSIIVDEESDSKKIKPLPNLEFKFICANSLIDLDKSGNNTFGDDPELQEKLASIRDGYFNTESLNKKKKLRNDYDQLVKVGPSIFGESEKTNQLKTYRPFDNESSASFFNSEFMFGTNGFNIVIGNPPYVSVKKISVSDKKIFGKLFETGKGRFNLFTLFLERGHKLLKEGSILTYILPEGLFSNTEDKYIRKYLIQKTTILEIGLFTKRVFEASVDTAIILVKNMKDDQKLKIVSDLNTKINEIDQKDLDIEPEYIFPVKTNEDGNQIIKLIEKASVKLVELFEVQQGIIYSGRPKEDVFSNEKISSEYKKILDGRDILRYKINWGLKLENRFIKYTKELHRPREERIFTVKEKIVLPRRSTKLVCALDDEQFYLLNTGYVILPKNNFQEIKYVLGILNSNLMNFYYNNRYFGWQITIPALNSLPIKIGSENEIKKVIDIVDKIIEQKKSDIDTTVLENLLNSEIYKIYNIDEKTISIIEGNL
jgi:methylase of polypeptide subunit release factors